MQHRHQLSPEEKTLVCNVYDYFVAEAKEGRSGGRNSCQRTKEATRFGKNTIFRVLRARNINPDTDFVEVRLPSSPIRLRHRLVVARSSTTRAISTLLFVSTCEVSSATISQRLLAMWHSKPRIYKDACLTETPVTTPSNPRSSSTKAVAMSTMSQEPH
ncbi:hypothetical protein PC114_g6207 [Phytophthora cactorum]|nr:hypothetical protein PC114_g6207 [Phytophthora cactorum]